MRGFYNLICIIYRGGESLSHNKQKVIQALEKYGDSLMRVAFTYTNNMDDAQDMVQEAFLRYIRKAPAFESQEHEKAWLIRVVVNICKNYVNSAYKKGYTPLDETLPANDTYSSGLWEVVNTLPEKYRIVIHLFYYEGYSQKEIARITGRTESAVSTRLQRGRELLRIKLGDDFFEE